MLDVLLGLPSRNSITTGDARAALEVLRRLGVLDPYKSAPEDPDALRKAEKLAGREKQSSVDRREQLLKADANLAKMLG